MPQHPSDQAAQLAKDLAKSSTDPRHGLTLPKKIQATIKPTKN
jgi:hypothetical protein